ncbi:50S ribosomal protein L33 [Spiroplasma clarkii]|uniref:50S ribosomal protein L33 n=1 Tax=Spiroplasma clarkii TaxID=2139 RepID=UPI000C2101A5|nr:50S ribosomal protein L33 [Spiroplasma clarkii]
MAIGSKKKTILVCEDCLGRNYSIKKSTIAQKERVIVKKFCSTCNGRTTHKETR